MLKRSHNEVINIFMNKINHALTLQHSTSESQMRPASPSAHVQELRRLPWPPARLSHQGLHSAYQGSSQYWTSKFQGPKQENQMPARALPHTPTWVTLFRSCGVWFSLNKLPVNTSHFHSQTCSWTPLMGQGGRRKVL